MLHSLFFFLCGLTMSKLLSITLAGALSAIALTPYAALADLSSSFATDSSSPFCFMQTGSGQLLDLTQLCGSGQPSPTQAIAAPPTIGIPNPSSSDGFGSIPISRETRGNIARPVPNSTPSFPGSVGVDSAANPGNLGGNSASPCFIFDAQGRPCPPTP